MLFPAGFRRRWLVLAAVLILAGCEKNPQIRPLSADAVVLAFGDSLTHGTGAEPAEAYPQVLGDLLQRRVINAGVPGEIAAEGLARLPGVLEEYRPNLLILCEGGNDFLRRHDPQEVKSSLRRMVEIARGSGAEVVLVGVPQPGLFLTSAPLYGELAEEYRLPYEGEALPDILADRSLKSDAIHPNAAGYARLADSLDRLIENAQR